MAWTPLSQRIAGLPELLAGPILRRTEWRSVTVWVAMRVSCTVTLEIYDATNPSSLGRPLFTGSANTIKLGAHLHVVAVTATTTNPVPLLSGTCYCYDLQFTGNGIAKRLLDFGLDLAYGDYTLPSFSLPPEDLNSVRLVHGSCRKPHGEGLDALPALDTMISEAESAASMATSASDPGFAERRPHQLFLTGDQIYADDVADVLLHMLTDAGDALLGWPEMLPVVSKAVNALKPGTRSATSDEKAGLTSAFSGSQYAKSHLFGLGEFYAMYLFVWSDVLWPQSLPTFREVFGVEEYTGKVVPTRVGMHRVRDDRYELFASELLRVTEFAATIRRARKALANVPTYMIFDDHEVSDDWYLNLRWCKRTLTNDLGRRIVQNGLAAYAVCQAWGNTPDQFAGTAPGSKFLSALSQWQGKADLADEEIKRRLRIPVSAVETIPVAFSADCLFWNYAVTGSGYQVIVLDSRTQRGYRGLDDPSALLSDDALSRQLPFARPSWAQVTVVVAPAPVAGFALVEAIQEILVRRGEKKGEQAKIEAIYFREYEAWAFHRHTFEALFTRLAVHDPVVLLSGDVHYAFSFRVQYWMDNPYAAQAPAKPTGCVVAQLTASPQKNEEGLAQIFHKLGFAKWAQELITVAEPPPLQYLGWSNPTGTPTVVGRKDCVFPPRVDDISHVMTEEEVIPVDMRIKGAPGVMLLNQERRNSRSLTLAVQPDWRCRVDFIASDDRNSGTAAPSTVTPTTPSTATRVQALTAHLGIARQHRQILKTGGGREIVAKNNIGEIMFEWGTSPRVVHQLWWRTDSEDGSVIEPLPLTKFVVALGRQESRYPRPVP